METPIHNCCEDASKWIRHYAMEWRFDFNDGNAGVPIEYCPFCGDALHHEKDKLPI